MNLSVQAELGGERDVVAAAQLDQFAALGVHRLEVRDREDHVAVAAVADFALDVVEVPNGDLGLLGAAGTDDRQLPHAPMVARPPDGLRYLQLLSRGRQPLPLFAAHHRRCQEAAEVALGGAQAGVVVGRQQLRQLAVLA